MPIIRARRTGFFSADYRLSRDEADLGVLDLAPVRSRARFTIDGVAHSIEPEGLLSGRFALIADGRAIAHAERERLLPLWYRVRAGDRQLMLRESLPGRRFAILHGDRQVGEIRPVRLLTRNAVATYDAPLAPATEIFLLTLVLLRWRQRMRSSG
ncbi:MAG TPA: hypothetical protein VK939_12280 [Longimicrobiales bacterium]|nr:hypothetical protein [Longimicrobiales bacterium]